MPECQQPGSKSAMYCRACGYDLQGQTPTAQRCPECARTFDPTQPRTFRTRPFPGAAERWLKRTALFLLILLLAIGSTWGWFYWSWKSEQNTLVKLRIPPNDNCPPIAPKWKVYLGRFGWVLERVTWVDLPRETTDDDLVDLKNFTQLRTVNLEGTLITDAGLIHLKNLQGLRNILLTHTQVTGAGLIHLKELKELQSLWLWKTQITDAGLIYVKDLKTLQELCLSETQVTDAGLVHLKDLPMLEDLWLSGTQLNDAGLIHLKDIKRLQGLNLDGATIHDAGLAQLKKIPDLRWLKCSPKTGRAVKVDSST